MQRLRRSRRSRLIAGVCGGIGERYGFPPFILRLVLIAATICTLVVPLVYLVGWLVIPDGEEDAILDSPYGDSEVDEPTDSGQEADAQQADAQADPWARDEERNSP